MKLSKRLLSLILCLCMVLTPLATVVQAASATGDYYVAGVVELTGVSWDPGYSANMMTASGSVYVKVYSDVPVGDYQFKITDGTWNNCWGDINGDNYSFSNASTCDVTIVFDPATELITVTGDGVVDTIFHADSITAVGTGAGGFLNDVSWDPSDASNHMTYTDGIWSIKYESVAVGTYEFKFAANDIWGDNWGYYSTVPNNTWVDAYYNSESNASVVVEEEGSSVELFLDLNTYDNVTKTGAKMKVIVTPPTEPEIDPEVKAILDAAYALASGESMTEAVTLTGEVIRIDYPYNATYGDISVTIEIPGAPDQPILCFHLSGEEVDQIAVADTITVTGIIKNYNGTIEFDEGCTLDARISGGNVAPDDPKVIVDQAFALELGASLPYTATLTGKITEVNTPYDSSYNNITVTMEVEGTTQTKALVCYRLKGDGADMIAVGDTITVTGVITNYVLASGANQIEFEPGCLLVSYEKYKPEELDHIHSFDGEWEVVTPNSCDEDGLERGICTICGGYGMYTIAEDLPSCTGSDYANNMNYTFPIFAVPGVNKYVINFGICELESNYDELYVYASDGTNQLDHVATLTGGFSYYQVTVDAPAFMLIMTTDHSVTKTGFTVASVECYTEDGFREIPAFGHSYDSVVTDPTCLEDGYTTHTCATCGDTYTDSQISALGHDIDEWAWEITADPTCTQEGTLSNICLRCNQVINESISPMGHSFDGEWGIEKEPTCLEDGMRVKYCSVCGASSAEIVADPATLPSCTGSDYTNSMDMVFPTVTIPGTQELIITFSAESYLESSYDKLYIYAGDSANSENEITVLTGRFGSTTVTVPGDSVTMRMTTDGSVTEYGFEVVSIMGRSGDAYEKLPALGHDYELILNSATCTQNGEEIKRCTRCGDEQRKTLVARHVDLNDDDFCDHCGEPFVGVLDLVFVIDTTGSMGGEIDVVKRNIADYVHRLEESNIPHYIAVVDFRDFSDRADSYDYPYSVVQDFTNDLDEILAGVDRLNLGNGGDTPETVYSGLMTGLDELSWGEGSVRKVILIGDAEPLDPEPYTGFELEQVTEHLKEEGVAVYAVTTGQSTELDAFKQIAEATGGSSYVGSSDEQFEAVMTDVIDSIPDSLHIHTYEEFVTDATCTTGGSIAYTCTGCGKEIESTTPPLGHDHSDEWTVDAEPTCTAAGSKSHHCSRCDHKANITSIDALGHDYNDWSRAADPTCTLAGRDERTCSRCGHVDTRSVDPLGHDLSAEWTVDVDPTCTEAGSKSHHCSRCRYKGDVTVIDALGHDYSDWNRVADPTCTLTGRDERTCGRCGHVDINTIDELGHDLSEKWTMDAQPTCTEEGSKSHHCSRCSYKADVTAIDALGHDYGEWAQTQEPTCTENGINSRTCSRCGDVDTEEFDPLGHDYAITVIAPTCIEQGCDHYSCNRCGDTYQDNYVDALGHSYGAWEPEKEAGCEEDGLEFRICAACGSRETRPVAAHGHSYYTQVIAPDCDSQGYTEHICYICGGSYQDTYVDALGHSYGDWIQEEAPTCISAGKEYQQCSVCEHKNYRGIPALGHSYGDWVVDLEATVLAAGKQHRDCDVCDHVEEKSIPRIEVDIENNSDYGLAIFTVVNAQTLNPITNAQIFISTAEDGENTFTTDVNGQVGIVLPVGKQKVSVYASGCLTRNLNVDIEPGVNEIPQIGLSDKPTYDAEITYEEMTYEEIIDAGIDVTAPGNQHVYKYELKLDFEPEIDIDSIIAYFNADGTYIGGFPPKPGPTPGPGDDDDDDDDDDIVVNPKPVPGPIRINDEVSVYPITEYFYLIIRGEVTWLKEMFDVEMLVINNSQTDTLENLNATLVLPDGLSLADMVGTQQTASQYIGTVAEGESESVHWYVRGDSAGTYSLKALLQGVVMPFEEPIDNLFIADDQIHVWAGNAMHLHFEFPNAAYHAEDYPIRVTLTNVSDKPLYNVNHLIQVTQGMEIYYDNGISKIRIETSEWAGVGVDVFNPGDKIIIESTVNIFFKSEVMEKKLQEMQNVVTGIEKLIQAYKVVKLGIDLVGGLFKCADEAVEALDDYIPKMIDESVEKVLLVKELCEAIADLSDSEATTGDEMLDDILSVGDSGVSTTLELITSDPEDWINGKNLDEIAELIEDVKGLKKSIDGKGAPGTRKFDLFDSLRTAISAIPIRYALASVVMTEDPNNTTSIPWSYTAYQAAPQYFGVSSVSKYLNALSTAVAAEVYDSAVPGFFMLIPGLDDPFGKEEAIRYIQATEDEIAKVKAKDATGEVTFKAWVVTKTRSAGTNIQLSCDNENAYVDANGVLHFTGDGMIEILPKGSNGGVLYIEDSLGNLYTYNINVYPAHTHTAGDVEVIIPPMQGNSGFGAVLCETCGDMIDVVELSADACGGSHSYGDWTTITEADCEASGMEKRTCSVCYANDYRYTDALDHKYETVSQDATCTEDGFVTNTCSVCGDVKTEIITAPGHSWSNATCLTAKTCQVCGAVEGDALGHGHTVGTVLNKNSNGTHNVVCGDCGEILSTKPCEYDPVTLSCACGNLLSGWHTNEKGTTYLDNGTVVYKQTMATIEGATYYFNADGYVVKGLFIVESKYYYAADDGKLVKDGNYYVGNTNGLTYQGEPVVKGTYTFDAEGVLLFGAEKNGFYFENGAWYYYRNDNLYYAGLIWCDGPEGNDPGYYYVTSEYKLITNRTYWISKNNGIMHNRNYNFDENGTMYTKDGFYFENGAWYYYVNDQLNYAGLIWSDGPEGNDPGYYYVNSQCKLMTNCTYWISKTNGFMKEKSYNFDENGTMYTKDGFYFENGAWYYYVDGQLNYAGLIWCDGPEGDAPGYYYVNSQCKLITNCTYWISKTNGFMDEQSYVFDEKGKIVLE